MKNRLSLKQYISFNLYIIISLVAWNQSAKADEYPWPVWTNAHFPLLEAYAPGMYEAFAGFSPDLTMPRGLGHRDAYDLIGLGESWTSPISCSTHRTSGFIQTPQFKHESASEPARVAFPIHVHLRYSSRELQTLARMSPLFTVYILKTNVDTRDNLRFYDEAFLDSISLEQCINAHPQKPEPTTAVAPEMISLDDVCLSKPVMLERGHHYEVRVEWAGDAICGETPLSGEETKLSLGDQIRVLADPETEAHTLGTFVPVLPRVAPERGLASEHDGTVDHDSKLKKKKKKRKTK